MTTESEKFRISDVEPIWTDSTEKGPVRRPPTKTGVKLAVVTCKSCRHTWTARQFGPGKLDNVVSGVLLRCPSCGATESVSGLI